jgi:hypothetical protein
MGIWGGLGSTEALYITGSVSKVGTTVYVNATIFNKGTSIANISKVEMYDETGSPLTATPSLTVQPGETKSYDFNIGSGNVAVGKTYVVRFYTSTGNVYDVPMKCVKVS